MLEDECQEAVRNLVRSYKVSKIRDIASEFSAGIVDDMNTKFNEFGVYIEHMIIMTVVVPEMLNKTLAQSTGYDVKIQNSIKKFQYTRLSKTNEENQKITKTNGSERIMLTYVAANFCSTTNFDKRISARMVPNTMPAPVAKAVNIRVNDIPSLNR